MQEQAHVEYTCIGVDPSVDKLVHTSAGAQTAGRQGTGCTALCIWLWCVVGLLVEEDANSRIRCSSLNRQLGHTCTARFNILIRRFLPIQEFCSGVGCSLRYTQLEYASVLFLLVDDGIQNRGIQNTDG